MGEVKRMTRADQYDAEPGQSEMELSWKCKLMIAKPDNILVLLTTACSQNIWSFCA